MKINRYVDISTIDREAKKDYIDRHSVFVHCEKTGKVGEEYKHPDDADHYIAFVQLWNGEKMLAQTTMVEGSMGSAPSQVEVDFYIVPKSSMKLLAMSFCTKHGLWQSEEVEVEIV